MPKTPPTTVTVSPRRTGWTTDGQSKRKAELPKNWSALRKVVIKRDRGKCVWCGEPGNQVDHIERGTDHSLTNLRLLCRACHMRRTGRDGGKSKRNVKRSHRKTSRHPAYID